MSSRQEELETVKAIIRALLIADKRTFTVRQFINEYRSSEGQNFPYAKFGHSDPLNFLRSLTDTVQVYQSGSEFYVKPNVTQDVQHVQKLVSRQKDSTSKPTATTQRRYNRFPSSMMPPQRLGPPLLPMQPPQRQGPPPRLCPPPPPTTQQLMRVKSNIKELLSTCVDGITLGQLEEMYARKHSTGINYTLFGHASLESFVFSMSDILCALRSSLGVVKIFRNKNDTIGSNPRHAAMPTPVPSFAAHKPQSAHTGTFATSQNQRQAKTQPYTRTYNADNMGNRNPQPASMLPFPTPAFPTPSIAQWSTAPPSQACQTENVPKNPGPPELPLTEDWTPKRTMPAVPAASRPPPACADLKLRSIGTRSSSLSSSSSSSVIVGGATGGGDLPLNPKVVSGFKRMFSNHPDGIWLKDFAEVYESETGQELRVGELGFSTLLQLLENCAGTLEVKRPVQGGDFMVCQVDRQRQPILEPRVLSTLESALRASDSRGLSLDELLQAYQDLSGVPLSPSDHGFTRQAFVLFLTGQLPVVYEPLGKGQFVLKWSDIGREDGGSVEAPPVARAPVASPPLLAYGPFRVQEGLVDREYCPVYVSQVFSIHNFYVQLKGNDTSLQLEVLMNELETVYEGHSSDTQVVDERHIRPGFPCAAPYTYSDGSSDWHRGMVVSVGQDPLSCKVVSPQSVVPTEWARLVISLQVLYVDYGTMAEVKKTMLRTLKDEFLVLPAQAIRATMGHLKPFSPSGWTAQSKSRFMELVSGDRTLMCKVLERQGVAYSINLCDTTNDPDVHISDILVEEGHALPADTLPTQVEVGSQAAAQAVDQQGRRLASQQASGSAGPQAGQQVVHPISQSVARHAGQQANPRTGLEAGSQLAQPTGLPVPERIVRPAFESAGQQNGQPSSSRSAPEPAGAPEENEDFMSVLRRELDGPCNARSIKPEYLKSGKCLMVLNYDQTPYVSSANVGQLLGLTSDQLLQNLEEKQIQFRILVLHRDSNVELFNQMAGYNVPGVKVKQLLAPQVTFFKLKNVNDLLNLFEFPSQRLRHEVSSVLRSFDPNADYWMNVSDDSDSDDSPSVEDELRKLSARRKEIHADIMTNKVSNLKVDELSSIETEIARCEALLSEKVKRTIPEGPQVAAFTNGYAAPLEDW
ncbi:tudor domain-containing protein 5 isoform X2 [Ixodes scapularis]|uniref:tudor domain-containing protein 5 isoform X2 n=1 Tax=Ixodes scapularis TaxID=6945 RepID=UPI001AD6D9D3|nr:tudor domain-containing protein 5 isoform X2 [Ixodes scapularis]